MSGFAGPGSTDILVGGPGNDTLSGTYSSQELLKLELGNGIDHIISFYRTTDNDRLLVDHNVFHIGFAVTAAEILNQAAGTPVANIASAQFIYIDATNALFYDDDGTGAAAAPVQIAIVDPAEAPANALQASDFQVI